MLQRQIIQDAVVKAARAQAKVRVEYPTYNYLDSHKVDAKHPVLDDEEEFEKGGKTFAGKRGEMKEDYRCPEFIVDKLFDQIDILNSIIDRDTRYVEGHNVEDIQIIEELSYLITPLVISNNPQDRFFQDLQFEDKEVEGSFNYSLFMDLQHSFRRMFKKNLQSGMIDIMSRKTLTSFDEIKDKACLVFSEGVGEGVEVSLKWNKPNSVSEAFWPYFVEADMVKYQLDTELYSSDFDEKYIDAWVRDHNFDGLGGGNSSYNTVTK